MEITVSWFTTMINFAPYYVGCWKKSSWYVEHVPIKAQPREGQYPENPMVAPWPSFRSVMKFLNRARVSLFLHAGWHAVICRCSSMMCAVLVLPMAYGYPAIRAQMCDVLPRLTLSEAECTRCIVLISQTYWWQSGRTLWLSCPEWCKYSPTRCQSQTSNTCILKGCQQQQWDWSC
jgi:hypothetical protein